MRNLCLISFSLAKFACLSLTYFIWLNSSVSEAEVGAVAGAEFRSCGRRGLLYYTNV